MSFSIAEQMKVKTFKEKFRKEFGLTIRVYDGRSFADEDNSIAHVRTKTGTAVLSVKKNMKVGNLEDKIQAEYGITVQIAGSDNSYLCNNDLTLKKALELDEQKMLRKEKKLEKQAKASEQSNECESSHSSLEEIIQIIKETYSDHNDLEKMVSDLSDNTYLDHWGTQLCSDEFNNNTGLAKKIFSVVIDNTENFNDLLSIATLVVDDKGLSDKTWLKNIYRKAMDLCEDNEDKSSVIQNINMLDNIEDDWIEALKEEYDVNTSTDITIEGSVLNLYFETVNLADVDTKENLKSFLESFEERAEDQNDNYLMPYSIKSFETEDGTDIVYKTNRNGKLIPEVDNDKEIVFVWYYIEDGRYDISLNNSDETVIFESQNLERFDVIQGCNSRGVDIDLEFNESDGGSPVMGFVSNTFGSLQTADSDEDFVEDKLTTIFNLLERESTLSTAANAMKDIIQILKKKHAHYEKLETMISDLSNNNNLHYWLDQLCRDELDNPYLAKKLSPICLYKVEDTQELMSIIRLIRYRNNIWEDSSWWVMQFCKKHLECCKTSRDYSDLATLINDYYLNERPWAKETLNKSISLASDAWDYLNIVAAFADDDGLCDFDQGEKYCQNVIDHARDYTDIKQLCKLAWALFEEVNSDLNNEDYIKYLYQKAIELCDNDKDIKEIISEIDDAFDGSNCSDWASELREEFGIEE